jgi:hypothetical protein
LIANRDIRLTLPARLSFAQQVARLQKDFRLLANLAPLLIGGFLASLASLLRMSGIRLRFESYLLSGFGLALFFPLLTFLSALVPVGAAAVLATSLVSALLLIFVGLTVGWQRSRWLVITLLVIFLGAFSLGQLSPWRGLFLTAGGLLLVALFMICWARRPVEEPSPEPPHAVTEEPVFQPECQPECRPEPPEKLVADEPEPEPLPQESGLHCPHCGRDLAEDYRFCPGCGHDTTPLLRCDGCGYMQFVDPGYAPVYCLRCGRPFGLGQSEDGQVGAVQAPAG